MDKIFDAHFHIIDKIYPLISNNNYIPPEFLVKDYLKAVKPFNISAGVVVSGSFQAYNQAYLFSALEKLGKNFVGVTQLPLNTTDEDILKLDSMNIRAVRFNIKRLDPINASDIVDFGNRVYNLAGWHSEFYIESNSLNRYFDFIRELPSVSIDHLGITKEGFNLLLRLVENGARIKATGFGRIDIDPLTAMKEIYSENPESLMFGTDLPSTRAKRPFNINDVELIKGNFGEEEKQKIFFENAASFYRLNI